MTQTVTIPTLPTPLRWRGEPASWSLDDGTLTIRSGQKTDWFLNTSAPTETMSAPALLMPTDQPSVLSARITVDALSTFDAGVLCVYQAEDVWAKLCFEFSPLRQLMIVSVVTRGRSDDANSVPISGNSVYLRLSKLERAYAFHYSEDGRAWNLVRHFTLDGQQEVEIGFLSQSPTGDGCTVRFSEISYTAKLLGDLRSGE